LRVKARLIRFLFGLHRWSGVVLGLLMLMWCVTGFVMMYAPYPATSSNGVDLRLQALAPIVLPENAAPPPADAIPSDVEISSARIEMLANRPALYLGWTGGKGVFDLSTGAPIAKVDEAEALTIARTWIARHQLTGDPSIKQLSERDEFNVAGYFNSARPFWQVRLNDADQTMLYVSAKTGEVRQRTTASLRFWSWLGAIPHWLYFTELRKDAKLWTDVVIWTSLAGCFLTLLGLFVGLRQFRRRKSTGQFASPYRGAKFWHHMLGLIFGVLVLTWTFSGFASMQPWGWLDSGAQAGQAMARLSGKAPTWSLARPILDAQINALRRTRSDAVQLALSQTGGELFFVRTDADQSRTRLDAAGDPQPFDVAAQSRAASLLAGDTGPAEADLLNHEDAYYYKGAAAGRLPVVRVRLPAMQDTRIYLDPVSAQVVAVADPGAKGFRWLHLGLHRLDVFGWLRIRPIWDVVMLILLAGTTAVCGLGAWMGLRKIARGGKLDGPPPS
jgi:uncharacterized iron-regulated membrane protein